MGEAVAAKMRKDSEAALKAAETAAQDKAQQDTNAAENQAEERTSKQEKTYLGATQNASQKANVAKLAAFKKRNAAETKVDQRTADELGSIRKTYLQKVATIDKNSKRDSAEAEKNFEEKKAAIRAAQADAVKRLSKVRIQKIKRTTLENGRAKAAAVAGKARAVAELLHGQSKQDEKRLVDEKQAAAEGTKQAEGDATAAEAESKPEQVKKGEAPMDWDLGENGDRADTQMRFGLDPHDEGAPPVSVLRGGERAIARWISQH